MKLREAAQQALEALEKEPADFSDWLRTMRAARTALRDALADTQDWDELEALRASLREHMAEIHRLRAAGRQALEALEEYQQKGAPFMSCDAAVNVLRAALEPVTDYHGLDKDRAVVISNLLAHFGITSADSDVNVAYLHKQLDNFLTASIDCNKERDKLPPPLKIETCEYPWCLSPSGCGRQCPAFPLDQFAITGETSDVPETNFGNIAQAVNSKEADPTSQESQQVEPVGYGVFEDDNLHDSFRLEHEAKLFATMKGEHAEVRALYAAPPKREPLTNQKIFREYATLWPFLQSEDHLLAQDILKFARAIERAHGIGGEK